MAAHHEIDRVLSTAVILLVAFGMVMLYSAGAAMALEGTSGVLENPLVTRQFAIVPLGLGLFIAAASIDYHRWRRPRVLYGLLGLTLLLLTIAPFTPAIQGVHRWLRIDLPFGQLGFQPSELAKLALVVFLAHLVDRHISREERGYAELVHLLAPSVVVAGALIGLVLLGSDLGTATLLGMTALLMLFLAGVPWRFFLTAIGAAIPALGFLVVSIPYRRARLLSFLSPEADPLGSGFQAYQSLIAAGSGGLWGTGLGRSNQKFFFLPQPHSDFIYSIIAEELGLLGALLVLGFYLLLLWRGLRAGRQAPDLFGRFLAWGLTGGVVLQAFVNMSVALAVLPVKGIPLPLISAGGSSLVVTLIACGILVNISRHG